MGTLAQAQAATTAATAVAARQLASAGEANQYLTFTFSGEMLSAHGVEVVAVRHSRDPAAFMRAHATQIVRDVRGSYIKLHISSNLPQPKAQWFPTMPWVDDGR